MNQDTDNIPGSLFATIAKQKGKEQLGEKVTTLLWIYARSVG
jgi:hypothetical protein